MKQDFSNITEEKLAELFPIILEQNNPDWKSLFLEECRFLQSVFGDNVKRISHIGSTAVPGLVAKPTIDILLEIARDTDLSGITKRMEDEGYCINNPPGDIIMYLKGYTPHGFGGQCMHIHVRYPGDWDEFYFRDYLIMHPEAAHEYGKLKISLRDKYTHNRDGYTAAKGDFVRKYTALARKAFPGKYIPNAD
jgi:GrpB-like predicted nucleotidyltransferase (UPF0157 family)